jgi:hypothetical protein
MKGGDENPGISVVFTTKPEEYYVGFCYVEKKTYGLAVTGHLVSPAGKSVRKVQDTTGIFMVLGWFLQHAPVEYSVYLSPRYFVAPHKAVVTSLRAGKRLERMYRGTRRRQ